MKTVHIMVQFSDDETDVSDYTYILDSRVDFSRWKKTYMKLNDESYQEFFNWLGTLDPKDWLRLR